MLEAIKVLGRMCLAESISAASKIALSLHTCYLPLQLKALQSIAHCSSWSVNIIALCSMQIVMNYT